MNRRLRVSGSCWLLLVTLAGGLSLLGQDSINSGTNQSQFSSAPHTIRGTVVNSVTGEPIYRALVQIGGQYAMLTDNEGHFEFDGVTLPGIPPWAMKPGYFSQDRFRPLDTGNPSSGSDSEVIVKLVPEAIISGTVTGQDGNPLEGIPVQLKTLAVQDGLSRWRPRQQTRTNSEGQYRFAELEAGKYEITTGFHTEGLADSESSLAYIPARYPPPGGGSSSSETALVLNPGDHAVADLNPDVEKLFPVTGTINGYGESRGVAFRVETASGEEFTPVARFTPRNGEFRVMLPGGTYQVTATAYMRQGPVEARREVSVQQGPVAGISFVMQPYATISVDVGMEDQPSDGTGQAGPSAPLTNFAENISLASASGEGFTPYLSARPLHQRGDDSVSGDQGPLAIENVSPGRYVLRAQPPSPWYIASASCGGVDLIHDELAVGQGSVGCSIRIVLRNDSGSAHATVRNSDQNGAFNAHRALYVYAVPEANLAQQVVMLNQQNGEYSADGMAPGRYLVLALDHHEELPYRDPEAMRRYSGLGQEITVPANGKADIEVSLATVTP
jgi:Carboxypeptidase regulatory-like domain